MFQLIGVQLSVAKQCLPEEYWRDMVLACLQVLQDVQDSSRRRLAQRWRDIHAQDDGLEQLCAIVNDCDRLQDKADVFIKEMMSGMDASLSKADSSLLAEKIEVVTTEYVETAAAATGIISSSVMLTLEEAGVTAQFFSVPEWEDGSFEGMKTVVETLADFFRDLHRWMPEFFFAKLARLCFERVVKMYVESLLRFDRKSFVSVQHASDRVADDMRLLVEFFTVERIPVDDGEDGGGEEGAEMSQFLAQAGLREPQDIAEQWRIVAQVNTVLAADTMDTLPGSVTQAAIKAIMAEFGAIGVDVVMQILELQCHWSGDEKQQRAEFVNRIANTMGDLSQRSSAKYELKGYARRPAAPPKRR
ncbi:unnamed protein product [Phaeothamnion confervicola]